MTKIYDFKEALERKCREYLRPYYGDRVDAMDSCNLDEAARQLDNFIEKHGEPGLVRSMLYFWRNTANNTRDLSSFYNVIDDDFPGDTYWWHVSPDEHHAAARAAYAYLKQSTGIK